MGLHTLPDSGAWGIGLTLAVLLTFVVRPLFVGLLLVPVRLAWEERLFVLWAGLKGAVPILLGTFLLTAGAPDAPRLYAVIFVVVAFSVLVQGGLVPAVAHRHPRGLDLGEDAWISLVIRDGQLVAVQGATILRAGDEVLVLADPQRATHLAWVFTPAR